MSHLHLSLLGQDEHFQLCGHSAFTLQKSSESYKRECETSENGQEYSKVEVIG